MGVVEKKNIRTVFHGGGPGGGGNGAPSTKKEAKKGIKRRGNIGQDAGHLIALVAAPE